MADSQPFHSTCFLWEKMISPIPAVFGLIVKSLWTDLAGWSMDTPGSLSLSVISPSSAAFSQLTPLPNLSFGTSP